MSPFSLRTFYSYLHQFLNPSTVFFSFRKSFWGFLLCVANRIKNIWMLIDLKVTITKSENLSRFNIAPASSSTGMVLHVFWSTLLKEFISDHYNSTTAGAPVFPWETVKVCKRPMWWWFYSGAPLMGHWKRPWVWGFLVDSDWMVHSSWGAGISSYSETCLNLGENWCNRFLKVQLQSNGTMVSWFIIQVFNL